MKVRIKNRLANIQDSFDEIAKRMLNEYILEVDNKIQYRITNIEFYYYEEGLHEDNNTHGLCSTRAMERQLQNGEWYLHKKSVNLNNHRKGIDYTIGDGINFGGILIKEVVDLDGNRFSQSLFIY